MTTPEDLHLTILRDTVTELRDMSAPSVSTRGWQRGWRAGVDLCVAIFDEIADEYEADQIDPPPPPVTRHRDAITGQYVTADEAAARPETTVRETRKP